MPDNTMINLGMCCRNVPARIKDVHVDKLPSVRVCLPAYLSDPCKGSIRPQVLGMNLNF
jgi:hypothetical protein